MPNIKSSKKDVLSSKIAYEKNKANKSELKTNLKKFDAAVVSGDKAAAEAAYNLDLALPEEEVFDSKKLCIKSCSEVSYLLNENTIIKAVFDDDNYDDGESGDTYYYNGDCLE